MVRAAGGVIERDGSVLLVQRRKYDDWSFPKGKIEEGESWEEAAAREVQEETGLTCEVGELLGTTHYTVAQGLKEVRYYRMSCAGEAHAQNEIDDLRWVPLAEARKLLTHALDRSLLDAL